MSLACDSCEAIMIQGVYCHETGCPNTRKTKVNDEWVSREELDEWNNDLDYSLNNNSFDCPGVSPFETNRDRED